MTILLQILSFAPMRFCVRDVIPLLDKKPVQFFYVFPDVQPT